MTVYVTAVERYDGGPTTDVQGCPTIDCNGTTSQVDLGSYPAGFVQRVQDEGTGLITAGPHVGQYLNWSAGLGGSGYWLDTQPRNSYGGVLQPFVSAASDGLPRGTLVYLASCGTNTDGSPADPTTCARLRAGSWQVQDQFTPGLGGPHHIDLYIGEETGPGFERTSPLWVTFDGATLSY